MFQKTKWTSSRVVRRSCCSLSPIPNFDYSSSEVYLPSYSWLSQASSGNHRPKATYALWWGGFDWDIDMNKSAFTQPSIVSYVCIHPMSLHRPLIELPKVVSGKEIASLDVPRGWSTHWWEIIAPASLPLAWQRSSFLNFGQICLLSLRIGIVCQLHQFRADWNNNAIGKMAKPL